MERKTIPAIIVPIPSPIELILLTKFNDLETFPDNGKVKFDYNFKNN